MINNHINVVDFHSHILPGADHGSFSLDTSLYQISEAKRFNVDRIIATPHFYPASHSVDGFISKRNEAYNLLKSSLGDLQTVIKLGAEVLICDNIEDLPGLEKLFVSGTRTLLLELPFSDFSDRYADSVYSLSSKGVDVVVAHADRYESSNIELMIEAGAKLQLNADSLHTLFKRKSLYDWLDRELVVALGSDIHGKDKNAYNAFSKAVSKLSPYIEHIKACSDKIFERAAEY